MSIWDPYGDWDEIARTPTIKSLQESITGNRGVWRPNFCSTALQYILEHAADEARYKLDIEPVCLDFGCGLGRNGSLLRRFFSTVVGADLPEMIQRFKTEEKFLSRQNYARLYGSIEQAVSSETFCALYDSVVFQHITDRQYVEHILSLICSASFLQTFVSVHNAAIPTHTLPHISVLIEGGWYIWHSETENLSFMNAPHKVVVLRRV